MVDDRLNSCGRFREGRCQRQDDMARLYLIPQILEPRRLVEYEKTCSSCGDYVPWSAKSLLGRAVYAHADEPFTHLFVDDITLLGSLQPEIAEF